MKKVVLFSVLLVIAVALSGVLGFYWGTQSASEYWQLQYLRQLAREEWLLEKFRAVQEETAAPDEEDWIKRELRDTERALSHEELKNIVENDQAIQRYKKMVSDLRAESGEPDL